MAAFFTSCSDDSLVGNGEFEEGVMTRITLNLSSRRDGTRATGTPENAAYDIEKIHDWWVAFVDQHGVVRAVVSRPGGITGGYVEEEKLEVDVPTGTYTLYAFANLSMSALKTAGYTFTVGSAYPSGVETAQWELRQDWNNAVDIPMSGKQSVTVTGRANEVFSIEVVRMLAKFDVQFTNESLKDITINYLKMSQTLTDYVPLLPNYTYLDSGWPVSPFVDGNMLTTYRPTDTPGCTYNFNSATQTHYGLIETVHGGPWEVQLTWLTGKSTVASDVLELSFTITSDKELNNVIVKVEENGHGDINYISQSLHLLPGEPQNFSVQGMTGKAMSNVKLVLGLGDHNPANTTVQVKDLVFRKTVARPYVRKYSTLYGTAPKLVNKTGTFNDRFYLRESQANYNISQRYLMTVNVTRDGGRPEDMLFALTKELSSIYRNDHIVLPVILSDYMVSLDVNFYPPILGYPAEITRESEEEFLCEFATQGTFEILPDVVNASNGYHLVYATGDPHYTYKITGISDPNNIFSVTPAIELGTGETIGELNTNVGVAYVDIEVTVHRTSAADQIYDRRIYIIRKNY